jgi:hypothetical protein
MKQFGWKNLYRRSVFFLVGIAIVFTVSGCGKALNEHNASEAVEVSITLPEGERPELFWYGVERRELALVRDHNEIQRFTWNPGQTISVELEEEDELYFFGYDGRGRDVVQGTGIVTREKKVSIPLRRLL